MSPCRPSAAAPRATAGRFKESRGLQQQQQQQPGHLQQQQQQQQLQQDQQELLRPQQTSGPWQLCCYASAQRLQPRPAPRLTRQFQGSHPTSGRGVQLLLRQLSSCNSRLHQGAAAVATAAATVTVTAAVMAVSGAAANMMATTAAAAAAVGTALTWTVPTAAD